MNLVIEEFSILCPDEKKAFNHKFKKGINLIVGEKDSGKTTLARAILYNFGCDVKGFDFLEKMPNNIYILDIAIDNKKFAILRKRLKTGRGSYYFKVVEDNKNIKKFYDNKSFKDYLNQIFNIKLVTYDKKHEKTSLYPNHIFLPFYTDQDYSWQNYLTSTFSGIQFINNYKKIVLEYFTGARSNEYYKLQLEKSSIKNKITELGALISSKDLIIEENNKNIKIIENIDIDKFTAQYNYILDVYKNIIDTEHKFKKELNEKIYQKNTLNEMKISLDLSIEEFISKEIEPHCPNCHQIIYNDMEENYRLFYTQENLIREREKIVLYLNDLDEDIKHTFNDIGTIKINNKELQEKLNSDSETIELIERANSFAFNQVNEKLIKELVTLRAERDKYEDKLDKIEADLNKLNSKDVSTRYKKLMIEAFTKLNIDFSYRNYYICNLESVNIQLSGAAKVQAFIAQYLSIYNMIINCENTINIPIMIDTFLKDDFNNQEIERTSEFVFDNLKDKYQSFVFISNNPVTLKTVNSYEYNQLTLNAECRLLKDEYTKVFNKYKNVLVDE